MIAAARSALLCVLLAACSKEGGVIAPTFQRMLVQKKYKPYGSSRFFPDGRAMRVPPAGTVPRERAAESASISAAATSIPIPIDSELLATGQSRFNIYCAVCHGVLADGQSVVGSNMVDCPPPSLRTAVVRALPPGALYAVISNGFGRMPSYAAELPPKHRWAVIAYLGELQHGPPPPASTSALPLAPDTTPPRRNTACGAPLLEASGQ